MVRSPTRAAAEGEVTRAREQAHNAIGWAHSEVGQARADAAANVAAARQQADRDVAAAREAAAAEVARAGVADRDQGTAGGQWSIPVSSHDIRVQARPIEEALSGIDPPGRRIVLAINPEQRIWRAGGTRLTSTVPAA